VSFLKLRADVFRYLTVNSYGEQKRLLIDSADKGYKAAAVIAE
jgi:hypothetical protein